MLRKQHGKKKNKELYCVSCLRSASQGVLFLLPDKENPGMASSKTITGILFVKKLSNGLFYQCCQRFLIVQADCGFYQLAAFENQ